MNRSILSILVMIALAPAATADEVSQIQSRSASGPDQAWAQQIANGTRQSLRRARALRFMWRATEDDLNSISGAAHPTHRMQVQGVEAQFNTVVVRRLTFSNTNDALLYAGLAELSKAGEFQAVEVRGNHVVLITGAGLRQDFDAMNRAGEGQLAAAFREHAWKGVSALEPSLVAITNDGSGSGNRAVRTTRQGPHYDGIVRAMNKAREKSVDPTAQGFKWQGPNAVTVTIGTMTAHLSDQGQWAHASVGVGGDHKRTAFALDEYLQGFLISGHRPFARGQAHDGVLGSLNRTGQVRSAGGQANQAIGRLDSGLPVFRVQENGKWVYKVGSPTGITYDRQFDGSITSD